MSQSTAVATQAERTYFNPIHSTRHHYTKPENKVIRLRCIYGRQPQKLRLVPVMDGRTKELLGVERLPENVAKERGFVVPKGHHLMIEDGFEFNMMSEVDRINWNWVQYSDFIGENRDASLYEHSQVMFYVEDIEGELEAKLSKGQKAFEAEKMVREWSDAKRYDMARLLGNDMSLHAPGEVLDFIVDAARNSPDKIAFIEKDSYRAERLLLFRLTDLEIIKKINGAYYYEQIRMGVDEDSALAFMLQMGNRDVVDRLKSEFAKRRKPALGGTQPVPVRGSNLDQGVSTPGQVAPQPGVMTVEMLQKLAPKAYEQHFGGLTPELVQMKSKLFDPSLLEALVKAEVVASMAGFAPLPTQGGATAPKPEVLLHFAAASTEVVDEEVQDLQQDDSGREDLDEGGSIDYDLGPLPNDSEIQDFDLNDGISPLPSYGPMAHADEVPAATPEYSEPSPNPIPVGEAQPLTDGAGEPFPTAAGAIPRVKRGGKSTPGS